MKLSKKSAADIAALFNSLHVAADMRRDALAKGDHENWKLWWTSARNAAIKLHDRYGIECSNYKNFLAIEH